MDAPLQEHEIRALPRCANCPFAETDKDDGKLYCHESAVKAQAVVVVLGVTSYWPEVQPDWACWQHPRRQAERRRLETGL